MRICNYFILYQYIISFYFNESTQVENLIKIYREKIAVIEDKWNAVMDMMFVLWAKMIFAQKAKNIHKLRQVSEA